MAKQPRSPRRGPHKDPHSASRRQAVREVQAQRMAEGPRSAAGSRLRRPTLGERVTVYLPPDMAQRLRVRCAAERRSLSDAVTEALCRWLK